MPSSGTYNFATQFSNSGVILEAFDRIQRPPPTVMRHEMLSARNSLNLEMIEFENEGFNFWKTTNGTINLLANTPTYPMPANLVTVEEMYYSTVNALGTGVNSDRWLVPMTRTEFAMITNKAQPGIPTRFWYQMLAVPQVTFWQIPQAGQVAPNYVVNWFGLQQMQDANLGSNETPDVPRRALDALCARLTLRLAEKFLPQNQMRAILLQEKKLLADEAWYKLQRRDQEPGVVMRYTPNVSIYGRMR